MLAIDSLHKIYPTGDRALESVSLTLEREEIVALIGPSGAGKSTLIRCINRLVEPSSGRVTLDGVELTHLSGRNLRHQRRHIGMIFQEYALAERLTVWSSCRRACCRSRSTQLKRTEPDDDDHDHH